MNRKLFTGALMTGLIAMSWATTAEARPKRVAQVPNGNARSCSSCHTSPGGGSRNAFGLDVEGTMTSPGFAGDAQWALVFAEDSDDDGFSNGEELGDPEGTWRPGDPNPPLLSNPADRNSVPPVDPEPEPEPEPEGQPDVQPEPEPQPEGQPEAQPEGEPEGQPEAQPEGQPEAQPEGQPEVQPEGNGGDESDEGCATAPGQVGGGSLALAFLALGLGLIRRRRA